MTAAVPVRALIADIAPLDDEEAAHRADALAWIDGGAEIYRRIKPDTPDKHLVSYCLLVDAEAERALLVDHRDAQRWLPTGGHVEPDEPPASAAARELAEELGIEPRFHPAVGERPLFITVTRTGGRSRPHTDVSLWFVFIGTPDHDLTPDPGEFAGARWWPHDDIGPGRPDRFDPHLHRCLAKLRGLRATPSSQPTAAPGGVD